MRARRIAGAVLVALLASACDEGGPVPCGLRVCDIREPGCQQMAGEAAACLRGVTPVAVPVTVVSRDAYMQMAADMTPTPEAEAAFLRWNAGLSLLGLAPAASSSADTRAASAANTGGFYSAADKQITVIDDGVPLGSWPYVALLVHEWTHAIQDARFDLQQLGATNATDLDRGLAWGAVFEGEATYVGDLAASGLFGLGAADIPWRKVFDNWQAAARGQARTSPFPVSLAWAHFRYPFGSDFVKGTVDAAGWSGVDTLFGTAPGGTREVIAGAGAQEPDQGPWVEDLGADAVPILPDQFQYLDYDRMGAWIFETFLRRLFVDSAADTLAPRLRGDTLSTFRDQVTDGTIAVWRLRLSSAQAVTDALANVDLQVAFARLGAVRVEVADRDLILVAAPDAATLAAIPFGPPFQAVPAPMPASTMSAAALSAVTCGLPAPL